jgi:hypothetical protein
MAKVSGRRNPRGKSTPINSVQGATTRTPSDDKPASAKPKLQSRRTQAQKIEAKVPIANNRDKVKPIGHARKPRSKAA